MAYWSAEFDGSDFAFDGFGAVVYLIDEQLKRQTETVTKKKYPEQSILALLHTFSLLYEHYPKCISVTFDKKQYLVAKQAFEDWYGACGHRIPSEHKDDLRANADRLFKRMDEQFLGT